MVMEREVRRSDAHGLPIFHALAPLPVRAVLIFRVGVADETLPARGVTHLVEHLALSGLNDRRYEHNGAVGATHVRFYASGTAEEMADFILAVTSSLAELPVARLDDEKRILRTEAANRNIRSAKGIDSWRFGPLAHGLVDYEEFGFRWLTAEAVKSWADHWFNLRNAVIWMTAEPPPGLSIKLRDGSRQRFPTIPSPAFRTPAVYQEGDRFVALSLLGRRSVSLNAASWLLDRRLRDRLRYGASLAYDAHAEYNRLTPEDAEILAWSDTLAADAAVATTKMLECVRELADGAVTADDVDAYRKFLAEAKMRPESIMADLEWESLRELDGAASSVADREGELSAITPGDVAGAVKAAFPSAVLGVPENVPTAYTGFVRLETPDADRIVGEVVRAMPGKQNNDRLEFTARGVSLTNLPTGRVMTLVWSDVAAALWWKDGRMTLIARDGKGLRLVPERWQQPGRLMETARTYIPADRWVPMDDPGAMTKTAEPHCGHCDATPATHVKLWKIRTALIPRRWPLVGVLCRDCGIAQVRNASAFNLAQGWWGPAGLVWTPILLARNLLEWSRIRKLAPPIRTSGIDPIPKGRPLWLRYEMLGTVGAVIVAVVLLGGCAQTVLR